MMNEMKKMKTLTLQGIPFEVVDEAARNDIESVKDTLENLPKNEIVTPDLAQNDPTAPDYVKNRTHYEEAAVVNEPLNITWDGNTEGLVSFGGMMFKVSDAILTDEQIKSVTIVDGDTELPLTDEDWSGMVAAGNVTEDFVNLNFYVLFIRKAGAVVQGLALPETGIYFRNMEDNYVSSLTTTEPVEHTKTVVKKLDKKYLPDDIGGGGGMFVTVSNNDAGEYAADHTYEEVYASIVSGQNTVVCLHYYGELYILFPYQINQGLAFTTVISGDYDAKHTVVFNTDGTITVTIPK
jgi:hypothetical protein